MLDAGQMFAHFKILKKLGEGGMGAVYLAEDQKLNRKVALKILLTEFFDNVERQQRFKREARTAAQISHPNVMGIYDIGTAVMPNENRELSYIVMEYIEGASLAEFLKQKHPTLTTMVKLAEKIAAGLAAAHKMGIVHRDIKADNIIVDDSSEPHILDFGLAKPVETLFGEDDNSTKTVDRELTKAGKIMGTVSYMSPEQAKGEPVDTRSDVFSFGVLLYRMLTAEFPFTGPTQVSTLAKILESRHEPPRLKNADISPELERIIDKCLQKSPDERYQDTRDLVVDLRNVRRQYDSGLSDTISSEVAPVKVSQTFQLSFKKLIPVFSILAVIIIAVFVLRLFNGDGEFTGGASVQAGENRLAILGFENKTGDDALDWLQTGLPEILLTDLTQNGAIQIISRERVLDCLPEKDKENYTHEACVKAAATLGAVQLLSGAYYKMGGNKIRIDARLEDIKSGEIILGHKVIGEDPFVLVDSLTTKIAASLNASETMSNNVQVASLITSSPEAYRRYLKGLELQSSELFDEAINEYTEALRLDSAFALAYMRIGMTNVFQGKQQEGARYFGLARRWQDKLPVREKSLLDIYANIWLDKEFDNAYIKLESFVSQYPDDKEAHSIYGVLLYQFSRDTVKAFAQFDTALQLDPTYQLALSQCANIYRQLNNFDKASLYVNRIRKHHPQSPGPYSFLGQLYSDQGMLGEAISIYEEAIQKFPSLHDYWYSLSDLYIRSRNFDKAGEAAEQYRRKVGTDPYKMGDCYYQFANLELWKGQFGSGMIWRHKAYDEAFKTGDSAIIFTALQNLSIYHFRMGNKDSAGYYMQKAGEWASSFNKVSYLMGMAEMELKPIEELRKEAEADLTAMRSRLPAELWTVVDNLTILFEGFANKDTTALIEGFRGLVKRIDDRSSANVRELGQLLIERGEFEEGADLLRNMVAGKNELTSAFNFLNASYYLGRAAEGLGNKKEAVEYYQTVLQYWSKPDVEIKEIADTRQRLARLTS